MTRVRPLSIIAVLIAMAAWLGALVSAQPEPRLLLYRVGRLPFAQPLSSVAVVGRHAYLTSREALLVVDVDDPARPRSVARVAMPGEAHEVVLDGTTALVAAGSGGLRLFDVSSPEAPQALGYIEPGDPVTDVAAAAGLAIVAQSKQVDVVDYGDPDAPRVASTIPLDHDVSDVALQGDLALVAAGSASWPNDEQDLQVFDLTAPHQPIELGSLALYGYPEVIKANGAQVFLGQLLDGNLLADTPGPPVTCEPGPCTATPIYHAAPQRTLPPPQGQLMVVDIADPDHPVRSDAGPDHPVRSGHDADRPISAVAVYGDRAYSAGDFDDWSAPLRVYEVGASGALRTLWRTNGGPRASGIAIADDLVYLATRDEGLLIVAVVPEGAPSPTVRPRSTPTPFPPAHPPLFVPSAER